VTTPDPASPYCPCLLCKPRCTGHVGDDRRVHQGCRDRLADLLAEIPGLYDQLGEERRQGGNGGPKVSGSRDAPVPGRLDVLNLRGPGSTASMPLTDQHGATPVFAALETWERDWRETRGLAISGVWVDLRAALGAIARFLRVHLDWACDTHDAISEFAAEVRAVHQSLRAACGDLADTVYVGRCPTVTETGACSARLFASTWSDVIRCPGCGARRDRAEWEILGRLMRENAARGEEARRTEATVAAVVRTG
jgi:hypothetical protein